MATDIQEPPTAARQENIVLRPLLAALKRFVDEEVCPVNHNCVSGFVAGAQNGWGWARNHVRELIQKHTEARDEKQQEALGFFVENPLNFDSWTFGDECDARAKANDIDGQLPEGEFVRIVPLFPKWEAAFTNDD